MGKRNISIATPADIWCHPSAASQGDRLQFQKEHSLPFKPYEKFGETEQLERRQLVKRCLYQPLTPTQLAELRFRSSPATVSQTEES